MTMFGKQFLENTIHFGCYVCFMGELGGYECFGNKGDFVESNNFRGGGSMAEQEDSRTDSTTVNEAAGSSSKDERDDGNWLQLGIGSSTSQEINNKQDDDPDTRRTGLVELNLLPETSARDQIRPLIPEFRPPPTMPVANIVTPGSGFANYITAASTTGALPLFFQQGVGSSSSSYLFPQHQDVNWAFRPVLPRLISSSSAASLASSPFIPQGPSYMGQPSFQFQPQLRGVVDVAGPSFDFRIIDPPRRPHCGIWFLLQASQNQEKAPILPQVPKSYLRIKDGRMTVRLLMKYLVNKLRLDDESEIEIRCKGERLEPYLTLQRVRDTIWNDNSTHQRLALNISSSNNPNDHIMVLHYARS